MNNDQKVLKIEQQVQQFTQHIQKYKKLFLADDGRIDSDEQQQLDALQVSINQINQRLAELKGGTEIKQSKTVKNENAMVTTENVAVQFMPQDIPSPDWGNIERAIYLALDDFRIRVLIDLQSVLNAFLESSSANDEPFSISGNILTNILINSFGVDNVLSIVEDTYLFFRLY